MVNFRDIPQVYRKHFKDPRKERVFLSSVSFFLMFAILRGITHAIRNNVGPFRNVSTGGTHIHHSTWGILSLLAVGYAWLMQFGVGLENRRHGMRETALLYGAASALTLDEFALWLNLQDDYWNKKGRESIDAVVLFGAIMAITAGGGSFFRELLGIRKIFRRHPHQSSGNEAG